MTDDLDAIRAGNDIVGVVGENVRLRRSGAQMSGLCPFRKEKTPSFYVHPAKQLYYCHGCHAGGDVIQFVQDIEHVSFVKAKNILAERVGITVVPATKTQKREYAITRTLVDEAEYFAIREHLREMERGMLVALYRQRCADDPHYRELLLDDRRNAEEMTAALVAILVTAQELERAGVAA